MAAKAWPTAFTNALVFTHTQAMRRILSTVLLFSLTACVTASHKSSRAIVPSEVYLFSPVNTYANAYRQCLHDAKLAIQTTATAPSQVSATGTPSSEALATPSPTQTTTLDIAPGKNAADSATFKLEVSPGMAAIEIRGDQTCIDSTAEMRKGTEQDISKNADSYLKLLDWEPKFITLEGDLLHAGTWVLSDPRGQFLYLKDFNRAY